MSQETQTFGGFPRKRWEELKQSIQGHTGCYIAEDVGESTAPDITVSWRYDEDSQTVTIDTVRTPKLITESVEA